MPGGAPRIKPCKYIFVSESQHVEVNTHSVWNDGELWRVVGIPKHVPTGLRFKVTLEQVPNDTPFDAEFEDEDPSAKLNELRAQIKALEDQLEDIRQDSLDRDTMSNME